MKQTQDINVWTHTHSSVEVNAFNLWANQSKCFHIQKMNWEKKIDFMK